jgi:hypothetical protein
MKSAKGPHQLHRLPPELRRIVDRDIGTYELPRNPSSQAISFPQDRGNITFGLPLNTYHPTQMTWQRPKIIRSYRVEADLQMSIERPSGQPA